MPKVVWYGDATKSQLYFLYYLMLVGCDVLLFHPAGTDQLALVDPKQELGFTEKLPDVSELQPFPKENQTGNQQWLTAQQRKLNMC